MGKIDEIGLAARLADSAPPPAIRAYHGSPHSFSRFDASKIGTGEGAQMYGHGLYFAGAEPVADMYRTSVSALHRTPLEDAREFWRRHAEISGNKQKAVLDALDHAEGSLDEAAGMPEAEQRWKDIIQHLYELDFRQPLPKRPGHMYEVEIGHPESSLLDWDTPLSAQPQIAAKLPGAEELIADQTDGYQFYDWLKLWHGGPKSASRALLEEHGIPGIKYQDQMSRGSIGGTRNYVIFPGAEDQIRILRKYAVPGAIGAGAASGMQDER